MSSFKYLQDEIEKQLDHVVEECGEFISAYGKMRRWGAFSSNPELDSETQEVNIDWVLREMRDIENAIERVRESLKEPEQIETLGRVFPLYDRR